jgi:hypothetical protein
VARHPGRQRADALRVLGRVVVAVLRRQREPAQRVEPDRLRVAEGGERLAGHDRLELRQPAAHGAVLEQEREPPDPARAERASLRREVVDGHHGRAGVEPERVQARAHGLRIRVAERQDHLRLRGRGLGGHELDRGHEIDRRAARLAQLCAQ